jgi:antirestriction protein ArdC
VDKSQLEQKLQKLATEIVTDPERLKDFAVKWTGGFHQYTMYNWLLIYCQNRNATLCAGFQQWKAKGRWVNKGESALQILAPTFGYRTVEDDNGEKKTIKFIKGFIGVSVFDVSQTTGNEIELGCSNLVKSFGEVPNLTRVAQKWVFPLTIDPPSPVLGHTDGKSINVSEGTEASMFATYIHELAHAMFEHVKYIGTITDRADRLESRSIHEMEAEAVSYLVCSCFGIKNDRAGLYIGNWEGTPEKLAERSLEIIKLAEKIVRRIQEP